MARVFASILISAVAGCAPENIAFTPLRSGRTVETNEDSRFDEGFSASYNLFYYSGVRFGPFGEQIILNRRPEDMQVLRTVLNSLGPSTPTLVDLKLPLRRCDYALLIAEKILADYKSVNHSFGPYTAYEERDKARSYALRALFNDRLLAEGARYVYLDDEGADISEKVRRGELIP